MTVPPPSLPSSSSSSTTTTLQPPGSFQNTSAGQQRPTLTNIHIRSVDDAKKLFYAVQLGMLPKVERRLDAQERRMLRPGNVYVWEEKGPSGGENGYQVCIERWTEGLSWSASRIRDDFLMYYENRKKKSDKDSDGGGGSGRARSLENEVLRDGERDLYVKQTYSVHRNDVSDEGVSLSVSGVGGSVSGSFSSGGSGGSGSGGSGGGGKEGGEKSGSGEGKKEKRKPRKWHLSEWSTVFQSLRMRMLAASSQEWVERGWVYASWEGKEKEEGERESNTQSMRMVICAKLATPPLASTERVHALRYDERTNERTNELKACCLLFNGRVRVGCDT